MKKKPTGLQKPLAWRLFDEQAERKAAQRRIELEKQSDRAEKRQEKIEADYKEARKNAQTKVNTLTTEILTAKRDTNSTHFALVATPVAAAIGVNFYMYQGGGNPLMKSLDI